MEQLLVKQSPLEIYFEWLDSLIERKVCEVKLLNITIKYMGLEIKKIPNCII